MRFPLIILTFIFLISCSDKSSPQTDNLSKTIVETAAISNQKPESKSPSTDSTINKNPVETSAMPFLPKDLRKKSIAPDDIEIRLWQFSGLGMPIYKDSGVKKSVFVLSRLNGKWSAAIFRETRNFNSKTKIAEEKFIAAKLNEPKEGWENLWRRLNDEEVLTLPNGSEVGLMQCRDCSSFMIEIKSGENYRSYEYNGFYSYDGEDFVVVKEGKQMSNIINLIAKEFDISDLRAIVPQSEK